MSEVIVACNPNRNPMDVILQDLVSLGFVLKDTLPNIYCFFGNMPNSSISKARHIKGVNYIEYNRVSYIEEE